MPTPSVYFYIQTSDIGINPCIYEGILSIATCKPKIRESVNIGDYIISVIGKGMKGYKFDEEKDYQILWIGKVSQKPIHEEYARIYPNRPDTKENPYHTSEQCKIDKSSKYIIICNEFIFLGKNFISCPSEFHNLIPGYPRGTQGHIKNSDKKLVNNIHSWYESLKESGSGKIGEHLQ